MKTLGRWQLVRRLGSGGSAEVFLARGPTPPGVDEVALKVLLPHLAQDPANAAMLLREARAVGGLSHPNIAALHEVGEVEGRTFLAIEYVRGAPLNTLLRALREKGQRVSLSAAAWLVREAALGLHHAHEQALIHRDVSPHNVMVAAEGAVKVVDFGLARATHEGATATGGLKGKLRYMPPEQLRSQPLDRRVDVFALGAVLWELVLGRPLYPGATEAEIFQQALFADAPHPDELELGLPRAFVDVLQSSVARDREKRTPTAEALAAALEPFLAAGAAAEWAALLATRAPSASERAEPAEPSRLGARPPVPTDPAVPAHVPLAPPRPAPALQPMPKVAPRAGRVRHGLAADPEPPPPSPPPPVRPKRVKPSAEISVDKEEEDEPSITASDERPSRRSGRRRLVVALVPVAAACAMAILYLATRGPASGPAADAPTAAAPAPAGPAVPISGDPDPTPQPGARPPDPPRRGARGTLVVTADVPAFVRAGTRDLGLTPVTAVLPAGRHTLVLRSGDGQRGARVEVEVPRGGTVQKKVTLEPLQPGR